MYNTSFTNPEMYSLNDITNLFLKDKSIKRNMSQFLSTLNIFIMIQQHEPHKNFNLSNINHLISIAFLLDPIFM